MKPIIKLLQPAFWLRLPRLSARRALVRGQLLVIFALVAMLASAIPATAGDLQTARKANLEMSQGDVRVILLRTRSVVLTNGQSGFAVTFAVEVPQKGAFSDLAFSSDTEVVLIEGGKLLTPPGFSGMMYGSFKQLPFRNELIEPATTDGNAMCVEDVVFTGIAVHARKIDIRIQFSWRGSPQRFDFKNVVVD